MGSVPAFTVLFSETRNRTRRVPGDASEGQVWAFSFPQDLPHSGTWIPRACLRWRCLLCKECSFHYVGAWAWAESLAICWYRLKNPVFFLIYLTLFLFDFSYWSFCV